MRAGVIISAISHVALVSLALFGTPKLFDTVSIQSIEVDLVRPDEIETPRETPKEKPLEPEKDKPPKWGFPAEQSVPESAPPVQNAPAPTRSQQAALGPETTSSESSPQLAPLPSIFDPAAIPMLLGLPNAPGRDFDAEATTTANLSNDERAAFKAHLRKCWKLPGSLSSTQTTRVVLRIYLRRDANLAGDPVLIEASASRDGPAVMQTALRALKDCQPYGFLPAGKYNEWKVLDLSFTPRDMAGG